MKALVKYGNKPREVEIRDVPVPKIGPDDILLKVKATGICGWDIEMWQHKMANPVTVPVVMGHEFCGIIEQVGGNVADFICGERVVSETAAVICGRCRQCRIGNYHLCPDRKGFGYGVDGAFTDYVKVPARCLHRIPEGVGFEHAALTEPACVAYQALVVLSKIVPKTSVVIIGPGPVGLFCLQVAKAAGANPVIVIGTSKDKYRFEIASMLGADQIIDINTGEQAKRILETLKDDMPLVVDAAGNKHTLKMSLELVARAGQITKIGWGPEPIDFSLDTLLRKAARLQGTFSHNYATWEAVLNMIQKGEISMEPMITRRIGIEAWEETFEAIERCEIIKAVMFFNV
jgi:alcohol dehydrogenase/L-iditol 2-dehydrogenase